MRPQLRPAGKLQVVTSQAASGHATGSFSTHMLAQVIETIDLLWRQPALRAITLPERPIAVSMFKTVESSQWQSCRDCRLETPSTDQMQS